MAQRYKVRGEDTRTGDKGQGTRDKGYKIQGQGTRYGEKVFLVPCPLFLVPCILFLALYLCSMYLVKTPWWLRALYPSLEWRRSGPGKNIYLSFDDGPHETVTPFVLDQLQRYNAKASFFCIGKNVAAHPELYQRIISEGHAIGNHTYNHVNGWKVNDEIYLNDVAEASAIIHSNLFRPPYGRIKRSQIKKLKTQNPAIKIIMWDVLSGDFDVDLTAEACLGYVLYHTRPGSVIVFHDSAKAFSRLEHALPKALEHFSKEGYTFNVLAGNVIARNEAS
jgi:peptidoglycan/xylan/chitin deacetylase (PgdA/CDA1 family)